MEPRLFDRLSDFKMDDLLTGLGRSVANVTGHDSALLKTDIKENDEQYT